MLRRLFIRDFVIVDRLELEFEAGFGALTGETGAGKSILVDALALALGERADATTLRQGAERAEIAAEFDVAPGGELETWLRQNDFHGDFAADEVCLLRRVIDAGGRSRATINGSPATLTQLRQAGEFLADIHGQHAYHALLRADAQRQLLDGQIGATDLAVAVATKFRAWRGLREARERAEQDSTALIREKEMLDWQVQELRTLAFEPARWSEENQEHRRLAHAASLLEGATMALHLLDEGEATVSGQLDEVLTRLSSLTDYDAELKAPAELLDAARIQLSEATHALSRYRDRLELEPARLRELEARIEVVTAMARKHRVMPDELPEVLARMQARLDDLGSSADPAALAAKEKAVRAEYEKVAKKLSAKRREGAAELSAAVTEGMQQLAMAGGRLEIALTPIEDGAAHGLENVEFLVAANPGQPLRPLAKVASGGELSRIGLAIQVIASTAGVAPTLTFDEVDVGIGGGVAEIVGRMLRQLGRQRQVLCVTHLPQVAAQADWQWSIAKETRDDATLSRVTVLDRDGRVEEIARMLGGVKITDTTRRHAREMLDS
ncbi:MAG: DNA repair protein RecN [Rhodocyclaceae bacterium]|nr:DNA repair protein RecN [Rhodocyclaceae bacterium]MBK6552667.1 DNA repair protein RecN [Rhodocyclaceae bacterium]MBK6676180.1 DNA repair protein RecN [Rhodocyclaceae bacterium]MBK9312205.1 DNA repair protein RecN [Rhodocyclaceae bacterium]MBK9956133.1 DNA repair protein RecN [Rhodocyclaceae bacterium]